MSAMQLREQDQTQDAAETLLLNAVMAACSKGLAIVESGRVLHANRGFAQTFGYLEGPEVEGKDLGEFLPEYCFLLAPDPASAMQSAAAPCTGIRSDGQEIALLAASAVFQIGGRELQIVNLCRPERCKQCEPPILPLAKIKTEFERFDQQGLETMGRVVGSVAHDFNNLLTGILLYCDLLICGLDSESPLRPYVEEIRRAGNHSSGLVQQLLSATRPETADSSGHAWDEVLCGLENLLAHLLGEGIELVAELDPQASPVNLSATAMRQIALNLLLNSRDAMPDGGRITLTTRNVCAGAGEPTRLVEFKVADTGQGMDDATCARIFEPFFTTKAKGRGNGLGLATVQRIVKDAHGSLQVQSQPGQGTCVSIRLPRAEHIREAQPPKSQIPA